LTPKIVPARLALKVSFHVEWVLLIEGDEVVYRARLVAVAKALRCHEHFVENSLPTQAKAFAGRIVAYPISSAGKSPGK
jgi:hypothetical protein